MAWNLHKVNSRLRRLKKSMPRAISVIMRNHYKGSFRAQGFTDSTLSPWAKRSPDRSPGRAILVKTGRLRDSIKIKMAIFRRIAVGSTGVDYAKYHNRGIGKQPLRKFVGPSAKVTGLVRRLIHKQTVKAFAV